MTTLLLAPYILENHAKGAGADHVTPSIEIPATALGFTVSGLSTVDGTMIVEQDMSATGSPAEDHNEYLTNVAHVADWKTIDSSVLNAGLTTDRHLGFHASPIRITIQSVAAGTIGIKVSVTSVNY